MYWNGQTSKSSTDVYDDITGVLLDPLLVAEAKAKELEEIRRFGVYKKVPVKDCHDSTGKAPIWVRSVCVNKGAAQNPEIRARLVC